MLAYGTKLKSCTIEYCRLNMPHDDDQKCSKFIQSGGESESVTGEVATVGHYNITIFRKLNSGLFLGSNEEICD